MGVLDSLLGKSKLPKPKPDKLFAMSTAYVTLSANLNLKSEGAGICFNFKQAAFYPFVPKGKQKDSSYEFRLRSIMEKELPIEKEVERWYPLWDIPL